MMVRILFLPDENSFVHLEAPFEADELVKKVNTGRWTPPGPYAAWFDLHNPAAVPGLRALRVGETVIIGLGRDSGQPIFSPRQHEVLQFLSRGMTNKAIAAQLNLHPRTVALHVAAIKLKVRANTRTQTVERAAALGLVKK
jgi:DNA-binding NarL/FixJ family response regulator